MEEGSIPYIPEERRELESGASVEGIPAAESEEAAASEDEDKETVSVSEPEVSI